MEFTTKKIVFKESGENWGTLSPVCFLENFTGNLNEKTHRFFSWDFDQYIEVDLYQVKELTVPNIQNLFSTDVWIKVKYTTGLAGIEACETLTENQFYNLLEQSEFNTYIFGKLYDLRKNSFCDSLLNQFKDYLDGKSKYNRPFSENQYNALSKFRIYKRDAENISNRLYHSKAI